MSRVALAVLLLTGLAAAWAWGGAPLLGPWPPPPARVPAAPTVRTVPAVRLSDLTAVVPSQPGPIDDGRNPFLAAEPTTSARQAETRARAATPVLAEAPPLPAWPHLQLIGVAELRDGDGLVRTAVIAGPRGVLHARPGDLVEQVYRLDRVSPTGADLRLLPEDRAVHLALRP